MSNKHRRMDDDTWESFKRNMEERTNVALQNGDYVHAKKVKDQPFVVVPPDNGCPPFCPECHGKCYTVNGAGEAVECSKYRERLNALSRSASEP